MARQSKDVAAAVRAKLLKARGATLRTLDTDAGRTTQDVLPSGLAVLDHYLLGGGWAVGNRGVSEVFGAEGAGKSSLLYGALAAAQRAGALTVLADTEHSLDATRAAQFGVDAKALVLVDAPHLEDLLAEFEAVLDALPGPPVRAFVGWDSLAATPTREEVEGGIAGAAAFDTRAKTLSRALRVLGAKAAAKHAHLMVCNQTRQKIGVMFGDPTTTPGGQALKSHASVRLALWPGKQIDVGGARVGRYVTASLVKSRFTAPRKVRLRLDYADGWADDWAVLELAKELGLVPKGAKGAKGLAAALAALAKDHPGFATCAAKGESVDGADAPEGSDADADE